MKSLIAVIVGVLALALVFTISNEWVRRHTDPAPESILFGARGSALVIDGAMLALGGRRIHLAGVDVCGPRQTSILHDIEIDFGGLSKRRLIELTNGEDIRCIWEEKDRARVPFAECEVYGRDVSLNETMIAEGWALTSTRSLWGKNIDVDMQSLTEIQHVAQSQNRGLWGQGLLVEMCRTTK